MPWARAIADLPFRPERWGDRLIRIAAPGGAHLLIRRHGASDLALWLPTGLAPKAGGPFGVHLNADRDHLDRVRAASFLRQAVGLGPAMRVRPFSDAARHAAMLYVHDSQAAGASLRDIAGKLLDPMPDDWRSSSERSDLRRLAETASALAAGGYRALLGPTRTRY